MRKLIPLFIKAAFLLFPAVAAAAGLQSFETDTFTRIVEKQKGKSFVLLVWSLDCEFCQASLKTLSEEKRKRKDLNIVTVSTDAVDDPQAASLMQKRLVSLNLIANAWAFGSAPPEQLRYAIDPKWHGEMPRSYWFNARGKKMAYSGMLTPTVIDRLFLQSRK